MQRTTTRTAIIGALVMFSSGWTAPAHASIVLTTPAGLAPGDQFRFVFVTEGTTDAISADITSYDNFINNPFYAATYEGTTVSWLAIVSTPTVNAIDHIGKTDTPVYLVDGTQVTTSTTGSGLWSGSLEHPINEDVNGDRISGSGFVWTGTNADGTGAQGDGGFGSTLGYGGFPLAGLSTSTERTSMTSDTTSVGTNLSLYAISNILVVPQAIPGACTLILLSAE